MKREDLLEDLPEVCLSAVCRKEDSVVDVPCHDCDGNRGCCRP